MKRDIGIMKALHCNTSPDRVLAEMKSWGIQPLFVFEAIDFLEENVLTKDSEVLELGAGNSTIWFAQRVKKVVALEALGAWAIAVKKRLEEEGLRNVKIYLNNEWSTNILPKLKGELFDLVVCDGDDGVVGCRQICIGAGYTFVRPGGYLIIDDSQRVESQSALVSLYNGSCKNWEKWEFVGHDPTSEYHLRENPTGRQLTILRKPSSGVTE